MALAASTNELSGKALVVEDHPLVARGISEYLTTHCGFAQVQAVSGSEQCLSDIESADPPELAVIDFWLPEGAALPLLRHLAAAWPKLRLLVVSGDEGEGIERKVREAGAHGFLRKDAAPETFAQAVSVVRGGGIWFPQPGAALLASSGAVRELPLAPRDLGLTDRQGEVLSLVLRGLPNKRIARTLALSEPTVKEHITNIFAKLGVANRIEAITLLRGKRIDL
jgi:DNA-binding NarL/FixJ family response regulator